MPRPRQMLSAIVVGLVVAALPVSIGHARADCTADGGGLGVSRVVEVDATGGPVFGFITKQQREKRFLGPKEVVLTFDDGPMPWITRSILDTLDRFCTKATFFSVGRMAAAYPQEIREILQRGHTLGTHTWSHPMSLPRLRFDAARDQIESGFAAVALAAGQPIAPFFRFPGLNDSPALVGHLAARGIATFTVDVVSNDSYISDPRRLISLTLARLEAENGGIMLFHDIKAQTAKALPTILAEMQARGYRVVHMRSKHAFVPDPGYLESVRTEVAARHRGNGRPRLLAITDSMPAPTATTSAATVPTTIVARGQSTPPVPEPAADARAVRTEAPSRSIDTRPATRVIARRPADPKPMPVVANAQPVARSWQDRLRSQMQNSGN